MSEKGHGRQERRRLSIVEVEPMEVGFPYARTALCLQSWRKTRGTKGAWEIRYYLSSSYSPTQTPAQWLQAVRGHWAGVENRNHWRKDACLLEDKTRSRNPAIVCSLILLRNAVLHFHPCGEGAEATLPAFIEANAADSKRAFALVVGK